MLSIPGVKQLTEAFVRVTFFDQFVGADTAESSISLLETLRKENTGCLFAYSVEVDEKEAAGKTSKGKAKQPVYKRIVQEMIHSIDVAADFEDKHLPPGSSQGRRTWVAVKLSALLPRHQALMNLSKYLVKHRPSIPIAFPGTPDASDLDILYKPSVDAAEDLTEQDVIDLRDLRADLDAICKKARERGVRIIIDAEHTWYQPAIDALTLSMMIKYNKLPDRSSTVPAVQPLVYNTYQAYLRRTPEHLAHGLEAAKAGGYVLGVKLVRGAYHSQETATHNAAKAGKSSRSISPDALPPVWPTKPETDACYNACARTLLDAIAADITCPRRTRSWRSLVGWGSKASEADKTSVPTVGVLFGTHNWESCRLILDELVKRGLAAPEGVTPDGEAVIRIRTAVTERLTLAQLYGMHDNLTHYLVDRTRSSAPFVIKYVPYGSLSEVMPYLSRRAVENKSVLSEGAAADERQRAWSEIRRRMFG
ncbi:hypothetical protein EIP86_007774 [Pleurotus ostreatoroseus]|nr:hypothetical protein EIP86_007774 [Pleurotus ostreatoroseus]